MANAYLFVSKLIASMLTDKVDVYRYVNEVSEDGSTTTKLSSEPVVSDLPGRISFSYSKIENAKIHDPSGDPIDHTPKIFFLTDADIKTGDIVTVKRYIPGTEEILVSYRGKIGLPSIFPTHIEVSIAIEGTV